MWIVRLALRRPYTFVVLAMVLLLLGGVAVVRMPTDIFPEINIPVVSVIWSYGGMTPDDVEKRIATISERAYTTTVNDIEHIESQSLPGYANIRVFFQPGAKIEAAVAQLTASSQSVTRVLPPGIMPPGILRYNAANVPILMLSVSSKTLTEQQIYDYGINFIRTQLATVQGASVPLPFGGKYRQVMVDLDPEAMFAQGLSATDISNAVNAQNVILPSGNIRIGEREYGVRLNGSPEILDALNLLPVKQEKGATILLKDVAQVRDGSSVQSNIVRENGKRSAMLMILKGQGASTLDIVKRVKKVIPRILQTLPKELNLKYLADQSIFVRASLMSVLKEAVIAAVLTSLMILLFLGSWRSTLIVSISIPLSIVTSVVTLYFLGETLNVMTLGGLALAVGILVDDATVEIENIHRNIGQHKPLKRAILDGAQQIAVAAFVSTLSICIVFVPVVFLKGAPKWLFTPLAMAVVFAMMASYLLSRTLIPTMVMFLLKNEKHGAGGPFQFVHRSFMAGFERMREGYRGLLEWSLDHRGTVTAVFVAFSAGSLWLVPMIGEDFFPQVDAGQIRLHVRAPAGTRLEETERLFGRVEESIRRVIPREEIATMLDNIGLPVGGINLAVTDSSMLGGSDGEILISLKEVKRGRTFEYIRQIRSQLKREFPGVTAFFQPADIVSQILNFGLPAAIDVQVMGRNQAVNYQIARALQEKIELVPGAVDVHMQQVANAPEFRIEVDRNKARQAGFTQRDVANSLLISLSSSGQVAPNYWLNRQNSVNYMLSVQTPLYRANSMNSLWNTPVTASGTVQPQLLSNLAEVSRGSNYGVISHYNVQPVVDIYASVENRDLGSVADQVDEIIAEAQKTLPRGTFIEMRGQVDSMRNSFIGLGFGLIFAILLVYFLMVINFQSWLDPFIIMMALPAALAGILWMLFVTQTTISVPSLMGAIMSIGVATANSILLVTFANEQRREGKNARMAALEAGYVRLRPVIMTALAMIIGMLPMAFGLGEGGEQNQPLGRAVIGGLVLATFSTLFFVPAVYSILRKRQPEDPDDDPELAR